VLREQANDVNRESLDELGNSVGKRPSRQALGACRTRRTQSSPRRATTVRERLTTMRSEYDFANSERGKFSRKNAEVRLPVYLEDEVLVYL